MASRSIGKMRTRLSVFSRKTGVNRHYILCQSRSFSWNPLKWGRTDVGRSSKIEEDLPDIFSSQPSEVEDYINPEKSLFERIEDWWDWVLRFMQPIEKQMEILRDMQHSSIFGFGGWGQVLFLYGVFLRLFTLFFSLYSHRNSLRMGRIGAQLSEITNSQNKAKNDRTLSTAEKRIIKEGYNRMKHTLYQKEECAQWKSFGAVVTAPVTASAFLSIRRLTLYETDLSGSSFLWINDLAVADATLGLPVMCAGLFLFNFELNQRMQRGGRSAGSLYIRWGTRVGAVGAVYFFSSQPAALFVYWIGLSCCGLLQPLLLRWKGFRVFFRFPDPPLAGKLNTADFSGARAAMTKPSLLNRLSGKKKSSPPGIAEHQARKFERIDDYEVAFDTKKQ